MKKNNNKSVETKKAYQNALMRKAEANAVSRSIVSENDVVVVSTSSDVPVSTKPSEEACKKALALLLSAYPAEGRNRRTDFSAVLSLFLKLNVDITSSKEVYPETERALNILGFTAKEADGKEPICKTEIPTLVVYLFNGYQEAHPMFCAIDADIKQNCHKELEAISKKLWHPAIMYLACQAASNLTEDDAAGLLSNNPEEISKVLQNVRCAEQTRLALASIANELGKLVMAHKSVMDIPKVISGNCPFAALNPADFPPYEEDKKPAEAKAKDFDAVFPEDKVSSKEAIIEEKYDEQNVFQQEVENIPEAKTTQEISSSKHDISSKQDYNVDVLSRAVKALKMYGDTLRKLEDDGFTIEDAEALVQAEAIGFSFHELLRNEKMVETLSSIVNFLK